MTGTLVLWAALGCDDVSNRLASSGLPRDADTSDRRVNTDAVPPTPDPDSSTDTDDGLPPEPDASEAPPDAAAPGELRPQDAVIPADALTPADSRVSEDLRPADAGPSTDLRVSIDGPAPGDAVFAPDGNPAADAAPPIPDLMHLPPFDAANSGDAGDAAPDSALDGASGDARPPTEDAVTPDALAPDASEACGGDPVNACGACGPPPDEFCNGLDDDCNGLTDESDTDADGMNDCGEIASGLDPGDPRDNVGDSDHDGVDNPTEVREGTWALPILFLAAEATDDPDVVDVVVHIAQPEPALQPILVEIFIQTIGRVTYEEAFLGPAAVSANKQLFASPVDPAIIRFTLTAPNVDRIEPGELARLRFRRTGPGEARFLFDVDANQLAPIETQEVATYGVGHPAEPLVLARVPLLINEVDYDQISTDLAEYVEILNPNPLPVALAGLVLEVRNGVTGALVSSAALSDAGAALGGHMTLVYGMRSVLANLPPEVLRLNQGPNLPNVSGTVRIVDTQTVPPTAIDTVGWEGARANLGLCEEAPAGEDPNDIAQRALGRCPGATDTDNNANDFVLQASSPGGPNVCP